MEYVREFVLSLVAGLVGLAALKHLGVITFSRRR